MELQPWQVLKRQPLLTAPPWLEVAREQVALPTGRVVDDYYTIRLPDYVTIVALMANRRVVTEKHYKHGTGAVSIGLPAGYLNPDEDPLHGAQRELREETGCEAERWTYLGGFVVDGNRGCGTGHFFVAYGCRQMASPNSDDLEETQVDFLALDDLLSIVRSGEPLEMCTATAVALALLEIRNHD